MHIPMEQIPPTFNQKETYLTWNHREEECRAKWLSEGNLPLPKSTQVIDDTISADDAYRLASNGVGLIWSGDFQNAKHLLQALTRRLDRPSKKSQRKKDKGSDSTTITQIFHANRLAKLQRARILGMLLIPMDVDYAIKLRRAPDVKEAFEEAFGPSNEKTIRSLRELLGVIGAHEWRKRGVPIQQLTANELTPTIHPHYGVFSPVRGEYLELIAQAPLPELISEHSVAMDVGTGTGVIAALLIHRGVRTVIATDQDDRAIACAKDNFERLGIRGQIDLRKANMFADEKVALLVCNPPWVPAKPSSSLEYAVYDPDSKMLKAYLTGVKDHLLPGGEAWLILSDLAEHLGLRSNEELQSLIAKSGLTILDRLDIKPKHKKVFDTSDPLHEARGLEVTSLYRLAPI